MLDRYFWTFAYTASSAQLARFTANFSSSSSSFHESGRVDVIDSAVMSMDTDWLYRILY